MCKQYIYWPLCENKFKYLFKKIPEIANNMCTSKSN